MKFFCLVKRITLTLISFVFRPVNISKSEVTDFSIFLRKENGKKIKLIKVKSVIVLSIIILIK